MVRFCQFASALDFLVGSLKVHFASALDFPGDGLKMHFASTLDFPGGGILSFSVSVGFFRLVV